MLDQQKKTIYQINKMDTKLVFTTSNFNQIQWHDTKIYAFAFDDKNYKFYLDVDLILEWINPQSNSENYTFKIVPATIVFFNTWNLIFDVDTNLNLIIEDVEMSNPHLPNNIKHIENILEYCWKIELSEGEIKFNSIGFEIFAKSEPILSNEQSIGLYERGGISFLM